MFLDDFLLDFGLSRLETLIVVTAKHHQWYACICSASESGVTYTGYYTLLTNIYSSFLEFCLLFFLLVLFEATAFTVFVVSSLNCSPSIKVVKIPDRHVAGLWFWWYALCNHLRPIILDY